MNARHDTVFARLSSRSVTCLLALAAAAGCQRESVEEVETTAVVPVVVETAKQGVLQSVIAATGVVAAAPGAELVVVAPAPARIAHLPNAEGDRIKAGDVLVRFDIPTLAADVASSRARVPRRRRASKPQRQMSAVVVTSRAGRGGVARRRGRQTTKR